MIPALAVLTCGAFLTVVVESTGSSNPWPGIVLAAVFALAAIAGYRWVAGRDPRTRLRLGWAYIAVMLVLGYVVFVVAGPGVGSTLLLMVLVSQSVLLLPLAGAVAVILVVPLVHLGMGWADGLRNGWGTLAAAVFTAVLTEVLQRERQARAELAELNRQLSDYAAQAQRLATAEERNRVARDIHDGLGHHLTIVQMQIQAARALLAGDPARADQVLAKAQQQATDALAEVRRSVASLREPRAIPPLRVALEALTNQTRAAGVPTELLVDGTARPLSDEAEESLLRAAQEGLTNVRRHAAATRAQVVLDYHGDDVTLEVIDDGRGTAVDGSTRSTDGFGLVGLRERAAHLRGRLELESSPGRGTTLRIVVPG